MTQRYQVTRKLGPFNASNATAAQMYYARKRRKAKSETTSGHHGGMREQVGAVGFKMTVRLNVA